jgi:hypothetical protein
MAIYAPSTQLLSESPGETGLAAKSPPNHEHSAPPEKCGGFRTILNLL